MADGTKIEWTDATVNAINGCTVVSAGCTNCYAMRLAGTRLKHHPSRVGLTTDSKAGPVWNGEVRLNEAAMLEPLRWRETRRIFWNAHGDMFHPAVPDEWIDRNFAVMAMTPQHIHQVLTKRHRRMQEYLAMGGTVRRIMTEVARLVRQTAPDPDRRHKAFHAHHRKFAKMTAWTHVGGIASDQFLRTEPNRSHPSWVQWPLPNVWVGVSIENNSMMHERAYALATTPAAVRFWSAEPLLGPIGNVPRNWWPDWVILGGESGPGARDWDGFDGAARWLRDQCAEAGVAFFAKQMPKKRPIPPDLMVRQWPVAPNPAPAVAHG